LCEFKYETPDSSEVNETVTIDLRVESDNDARETLKNKVSSKAIENKVCSKDIQNNLELEVVECKNELESEDECAVSENNADVSIVKLLHGNVSSVCGDKLNSVRSQPHFTSKSINESRINKNEDSRSSNDDCIVLDDDIDLDDVHVSKLDSSRIANKVGCGDASGARGSLWENTSSVVGKKAPMSCRELNNYEGDEIIDKRLKIKNSPSQRSRKRRIKSEVDSSTKKRHVTDICLGDSSSSPKGGTVSHRKRIETVASKRNIFESMTINGDHQATHGDDARALASNRVESTKRKDTDPDSDVDDNNDPIDNNDLIDDLGDTELEFDFTRSVSGKKVVNLETSKEQSR